MKKGLSLPADNKRSDKEHERGGIAEEENVYWEGRLKEKDSPHSNGSHVFFTFRKHNHKKIYVDLI